MTRIWRGRERGGGKREKVFRRPIGSEDCFAFSNFSYKES